MGVVTEDGLFEGKISTRHVGVGGEGGGEGGGEQYVITRSRHHFTDPQPFHSVIYRHSDVHVPSLHDSQCKSDEIHRKLRTLQQEEGLKRLNIPPNEDTIHDKIRTFQEKKMDHRIRNFHEGELGQRGTKTQQDSRHYNRDAQTHQPVRAHAQTHAQHRTRLKASSDDDSKSNKKIHKHQSNKNNNHKVTSISEQFKTRDLMENRELQINTQYPAPGFRYSDMDGYLPESDNNKNVNYNDFDSKTDDSSSNLYRIDNKDNHHHHKHSKNPAKNHKSAQNNHHYHHQNHHHNGPHHHHNHQKHHHHHSNHHQQQQQLATADQNGHQESKSEFQRLIDDYGNLGDKLVAIDNIITMEDLEEVDLEIYDTANTDRSDKEGDNHPSQAQNNNSNNRLVAENPDKYNNDTNSLKSSRHQDHVVGGLGENEGSTTRGPQQHHSRQKRTMIDPTRITCSLYLQADHLFFHKFHSNEETVIEQLTQHVQGVNEIYGAIGKSLFIVLYWWLNSMEDPRWPLLSCHSPRAGKIVIKKGRRRFLPPPPQVVLDRLLLLLMVVQLVV